jgi:excisionase family DNA binding protein
VTLSDLQGRATIRVDECARLLGIGERQAREAIARGELPSIRVGRRVLVPVPALRRLLGEEVE